MATKTVVIAGATYSDVPGIKVSDGTNENYAVFTDDADASASDIASGKTAYVNGELVTGTNSGGFSYGTLLYHWDFTQSYTDLVGGVTATVNAGSVSRDSSGLHLNSTSADVYTGIQSNQQYSYVMEIGDCSADFSGHGRLLVNSSTATGTADRGFIYRSTGYWSFYGGGWQPYQLSDRGQLPTDKNAFANMTVAIIASSCTGSPTSESGGRYDSITCVADGKILFTTQNFSGSYRNYFISGRYLHIGASSNSFNGITIKSLKVYQTLS